MAFARPLLRGVQGMRFRKMMGAGRGLGFTLLPDWGRYALLAVWEHEDDARRFLEHSRFMRRYRSGASGEGTIFLQTLAAHGAWGGRNPFLPAQPEGRGRESDGEDGRIAILTRARIRPMRLRAFWSRVRPVSDALQDAPGLECSIGIGEAPLILQATLSVWSSGDAMEGFAYRSAAHLDVIRRTRRESWYGEELFARFRVLDITGHVS